jgi:hypothetical protein
MTTTTNGKPRKVQLVRGSNEHIGDYVEAFVDGVCVDSANDRTDPVDAFTHAARAVAEALGATVEEAAEADPQPYRYFVTYVSINAEGAQLGFGNAWADRVRPLESREDTMRLEADLRQERPGTADLVITGFQLIDGPC